MTNDIFASKYISPEEEQTERAQRAVRAFRAMQPGLSGYARAITGKATVQVELASGAPRTDGTKIFFKPPIALGDMTPHERTKCERRDRVTRQQLCEACRTREEVLIAIYHEIAHIVFGTFEPTTEAAKNEALERAIEEAPGRFADKIRDNWSNVPDSKKADYLNLSSLISPFLPTLVNALEDARVDEGMFKARKGTKIMFDAFTRSIFAKGIEADDGSFTSWATRPLNSQAIIGVFVLACYYDYEGWFDPEVEEALGDKRLRELTSRVSTVRSAEGTYNLAFPILARLRELGFCRLPDEPDEPESDNQPEDEETDEQDSEQDPDQDDEAPEPDQEDSEPGDGQPSDDVEYQDAGEHDEADDGGSSDSSDEVADGEDGDPGEEEEAGSGEDADVVDDISEDQGEADSDPVSDGTTEPEPEGSGEPGGSGDGSSRGDGEPGDDGQAGGSFDWSDLDGAASDAGPLDDDEPETDADGAESAPEAGSDGGEDQQAESSDDDTSGDSDGESLGDSDEPSGDGDDLSDSTRNSGDDIEAEGAEGRELIDSGADEGKGGTGTEQREMGTADEAARDIQAFSQHEIDVSPPTAQEQSDEEALDIAIIQGEYFETPSKNVTGVREHKFEVPVYDSQGHNVSTAWGNKYGWMHGVETDLNIPESVLGPALLEMRRTFSDNQRADHQRNLKSGRVNGRVLGKRAPVQDPRLFKKKRLPGKKSYAVIIGIDISGSTIGLNLALAKRAAMAQAILLHRAGIDFAIYAHTANGEHLDWEKLFLDIYEIKGFDSPWDDKAHRALDEIDSDSANIDGHTIEYYRRAIERHPATEKIILYYTDGKMPAENHDEELGILQREIATCKRKMITLMGVGIRTDSPRRHGLDTVRVDDDSDITKVVRHLQSGLLGNR